MNHPESNNDIDSLQTIKSLIRSVQLLLAAVIMLLFFTVLLLPLKGGKSMMSAIFPRQDQTPEKVVTVKADDGFWHAPDESTLEGHPKKESILYGKDIIVNTSKYFGPKGIVKMNGTNGMNCQNCHLEAGTKVFGNNYSAVFSTYPKYRARSGSEEDITKRVNDCFERSLNGEALDIQSKEMTAVVNYINWLGKDVPKGEKPKGSGLKDLAFLDRAADPVKGQKVYVEKCQSCHQADGQGVLNGDQSGYTFPPLWGPHSYNDGAGLYRISNFAKYAMYNMPQGVSHDNTILTPEEAWDIAAYVNTQPRPKMNISKDWPKIEEKPIDHPFGPFADGFSEEQHKFGPFKPIKEKADQLKASKKL
jgi:thiosulfate dehydrogenase